MDEIEDLRKNEQESKRGKSLSSSEARSNYHYYINNIMRKSNVAIMGINPGLIYRLAQSMVWQKRKVHLILQEGLGLDKVFSHARYAASVTVWDLKAACSCPADSTELLQKFCERNGITFLVPGCMETTILLAKVKEDLQGIIVYPCSSAEMIQRLADKRIFAKILDEFVFSQPSYFLVHTESDLNETKSKFPIVLKAPCLEDGRGVKVCNNPDEAVNHFEDLKKISIGPYIAQNFIPGIDIDLTVLANHGKLVAWSVYTHKMNWGGKSYDFIDNPNYLDIGKQLVRVLNFHGILHLDGRLSSEDGSIYIIECNPRVFGSIHVTNYTGLDFLQAGEELALFGKNPEPPLRSKNGIINSPKACLSMIMKGNNWHEIFTPGTLISIHTLWNDPLLVCGWFLRRFHLGIKKILKSIIGKMGRSFKGIHFR